MIRFKGIVFRFHPLFVMIMLLSVFTGRLTEVVTLFGIVLFHEIGHLGMALRFGWKIREVKLLPFGGVVETEEAGSAPVREEVQVALAGPLQNALLAGLSWSFAQFGWVDPAWADDFAAANVMILLFNLLPILPLDGGKIALAWFSLKLPFHRTLWWSARISLLFSGLVVLASVSPLLTGGLIQLNLLIIGIFLCASNWTYMRNVPFVFLRFLVHRAARSDKRISGGTLAQPIVISNQRPLSACIQMIMKERYHLVYVMEQGRIVRVVPEGKVIDGFLGTLTNGHADFRIFM